jgi:glycosyltransferase involved in cell wall biosynthesis
MKCPLVSVIVNCHNGQKYLAECIRSILNQTYTNFEIIFWDNFSTDNSYKIVNKFKDKRIRKFKIKKFSSLYKSRNLAISKSKGKYITFCDTDDLWIKNKLAEQLKLIKKNKNIKLIFSNYFVLNEIKKTKYKKFEKRVPERFTTQDLLNNYTMGILTIMLDKKILKNNSFNPAFNIIGDFDLFIKLSIKFKFHYIQKPLAVYRIHKHNLSLGRHDIYIAELEKWISTSSKYRSLKNHSFLQIKYLLYKLRIKYFFQKYFNLNLGV